MDLSIQDVMNDLVREDAARMSGRDFADARGTGVARRVRTRRTVRAAGIGGGTMLTAGALVAAAINMPWETKAAPGTGGVGGGDCATPWPSPYPYDVQKSYADYLPEEMWRITLSPPEEVVFMITPEDVGQTWLVTYPSGTTEVVPYSGAGEVRVDAPDGPSILLSVRMVDGGTEMAVTAYSVTPGGPLIAPIGDCYAQGATPTPSSGTVRPSTDPSLAASTEQITSPFQCGFVFDTQSLDAAHLTVTATSVMKSTAVSSVGDNSVDPGWTALTAGGGVTAVHAVAHTSVGADQSGAESRVPIALGGQDPAASTNPTHFGNALVLGGAFVSVNDGVVVGIERTAGIGESTADVSPSAVTSLDNNQVAFTLQAPVTAFEPCPGAAQSAVSVDVYFVAGSVATVAKGSEIVAGPEYAWSFIATFRRDVPSNYYPSN